MTGWPNNAPGNRTAVGLRSPGSPERTLGYRRRQPHAATPSVGTLLPVSNMAGFMAPHVPKNLDRRSPRPYLRGMSPSISASHRWFRSFVRVVLLLWAVAMPFGVASGVEPCCIEVVERGTGWPVPLVELRTMHQARFVTDNAGVIAFDLPELMGRKTWFDVLGHGYEVPKDGFGYRGVALTPEPGKTLRLEVDRTIVARRLGRLTGGGLFAESQKLGRELDWRESGVLGCDSVQNAVHRGRLFWAWGDTAMPNYPLGIFDMTGATTAIQPLTVFEPPLRLKLDYISDAQGRPRGVAPIPGSGPTWISGYVSLPDQAGTPRLVGTYAKIRPPMEAYEFGLCVWNDQTSTFERLRVLWSKSPAEPKPPTMPEGQPAFWNDAQGRAWVFLAQRCRRCVVRQRSRRGRTPRPGKFSRPRRASLRHTTTTP